MEFRDRAGTVLKLEDVAVTVSQDATRSQPPLLMEEQIVAHGIRHLAYLVKTNTHNFLDVSSPGSLCRFKTMDNLLACKFN
jgi:hypothetical protein